MKTLGLLAVVALAATGCGGLSMDDTEELGHAAVDVLASFDETGTGGGFAMLDRPGFDRGSLFDRALELALPSAWAAGCWSVRFSDCNAGKRVKDFGACALGPYKLDGSVTLSFSDQTCSLAAAGDSVTRTADFTLTGRRNATLTVSAPGGGQKATRTADGYRYTVLGMQRVIKDGRGREWVNISNRTLDDLVIKGFTRADRVIESGTMEIKHNLAGYTVALTPENVTWNGTCNCPVSGTLNGTITEGQGQGKTARVELTGCGTGEVTVGEEVAEVNFDRCTAL